MHEAYNKCSGHNLHCLNSYPKNAGTESDSCYRSVTRMRTADYSVDAAQSNERISLRKIRLTQDVTLCAPIVLADMLF